MIIDFDKDIDLYHLNASEAVHEAWGREDEGKISWGAVIKCSGFAGEGYAAVVNGIRSSTYTKISRFENSFPEDFFALVTVGKNEALLEFRDNQFNQGDLHDEIINPVKSESGFSYCYRNGKDWKIRIAGRRDIGPFPDDR